mgnify:FL=1
MSQRFIKFIDSEESDYLLEHYPNAFLLLCYIAKKARRTLNGVDGLLPGEAIIGEIESSKKCGLKKKEYRNALLKLEEFGFIETVFNPKNTKPQKRTIKRAIKSKVVNICNTKVFDINQEQEGDQKGDLGANKGRSEGDKQECKERTKNEKKLASLLKESVEEKDEHFSLSKKQAIGSPTFGLPAALSKKNSDEFDGIKIYCEAHEVDFSDKTIQSLLEKFDVQMIIDSLRVANNTPGVRSKAALAIKILNDMKKQGKIHAIYS